MSEIPAGLRYSKEHEWVRVEGGDEAVIGITDFAQDQLGDVVYLDLPEAGSTVTQFERFGEVESVKSVSDLFSPVSGEVVERNQGVVDSPELVNSSPYEDGWLLRVRMSDPAGLERLMSAEEYEAHVRQEQG